MRLIVTAALAALLLLLVSSVSAQNDGYCTCHGEIIRAYSGGNEIAAIIVDTVAPDPLACGDSVQLQMAVRYDSISQLPAGLQDSVNTLLSHSGVSYYVNSVSRTGSQTLVLSLKAPVRVELMGDQSGRQKQFRVLAALSDDQKAQLERLGVELPNRNCQTKVSRVKFM